MAENGSIGFIERKRWVFLGLPFTFTKYSIKEDMITVSQGLFKIVENDCYMYKVQDVELTATLFERLVRIGSVICYTGDTTHKKLVIAHVRNARAIKDFILEKSEEARLKRRTVNMVDIGTDQVDLDGDGVPDILQ
ncbi:MAG: PH domain-containing protein [Lachnospiraceae bacterium]|nr:PH domain-containing protein [Lachnospiraceae bacterium]